MEKYVQTQKENEEEIARFLKIASLLPHTVKLDEPIPPEAGPDYYAWLKRFEGHKDFLSYLKENREYDDKRAAYGSFEWIWTVANAMVEFSERVRGRAAEGWISGMDTIAIRTRITMAVGMTSKKKNYFILDLSYNSFLEACKSQDIRRFRRCKRTDSCQNLFFAARLDQLYCTEKCRDANNSGSYRKRLKKSVPNVRQAGSTK